MCCNSNYPFPYLTPLPRRPSYLDTGGRYTRYPSPVIIGPSPYPGPVIIGPGGYPSGYNIGPGYPGPIIGSGCPSYPSYPSYPQYPYPYSYQCPYSYPIFKVDRDPIVCSITNPSSIEHNQVKPPPNIVQPKQKLKQKQKQKQKQKLKQKKEKPVLRY
jgi:hypothetical protein